MSTAFVASAAIAFPLFRSCHHKVWRIQSRIACQFHCGLNSRRLALTSNNIHRQYKTARRVEDKHSLVESSIESEPHIGVLSQPILDYFMDRTIKVFVDGTLGAGDHAHQILSLCSSIEKYIAFDQDQHALQIAKKRLEAFQNKVDFVYGNFRNMKPFFESKNVNGHIDGMLLDIGVSSMQLDSADRGFSFRLDGPLDMRMDAARGSGLTAKDIVNMWPEEEIGHLVKVLGEEPRWRRIAAAIVTARRTQTIETTSQLAGIIEDVVGTGGYNKYGKKKIHPATLVFQALRIQVNSELESLQSALPVAIESLTPGYGRLAVISFHSLEDRIVKQVFKEYSAIKGGVRILTKRPIMADDAEIDVNPRSRSAKLRIVERMLPDEKGGRKNKYQHFSQFGDSEDEDEDEDEDEERNEDGNGSRQ